MTGMETVLLAVLTGLGLAIVLTFVRFILGPSLADRVIALDLLSTIGVCVIAVYGVLTGYSAFLDVALLIALISFLGTVAIAYYLDRRSRP